MRNGWWKMKMEATLDGISFDFDRLPQEAKQRIMAMVRQGAVAGGFLVEGDPEPKPKEDQQGGVPDLRR